MRQIERGLFSSSLSQCSRQYSSIIAIRLTSLFLLCSLTSQWEPDVEHIMVTAILDHKDWGWMHFSCQSSWLEEAQHSLLSVVLHGWAYIWYLIWNAVFTCDRGWMCIFLFTGEPVTGCHKKTEFVCIFASSGPILLEWLTDQISNNFLLRNKKM